MKPKKFKKGDKVVIKKNLSDIGISNPDLIGKIMTIGIFTGYEDDYEWYRLDELMNYEIREDKLTLVRPAEIKKYKIELIVLTDEKIDENIIKECNCRLNDNLFSGSYKIKIKEIKNKATKTN